MDEIKKNKKKWFYWFLLGLSLIIIYKILDNFSVVTKAIGQFFKILAPFFAGILIAYLLYIPCRKFENGFSKSKSRFVRRKARSLSILCVYLIVIAIFVILINIILPVVWESIVDFVNNGQYYYSVAIDKYNSLPSDSILKNDVIKEAISNVQNIDLRQYVQTNTIMEYISKIIGAISEIFNIFVAIVVSVYLLAERRIIINALRKMTSAIFKESTYKNIDKYYNHVNEIFFSFVAGQFIDAIVIGVLMTIAMSIMKIKFAPLLGFVIGLFNMIPYIGAIIAVVISALITLITGGLKQTIIMLIVVIIIQQIDANIINPKILGQSLKISPLLVLLAVTIGGSYFGMIGMFLSVPIIAILKTIIDDAIDYKLKSEKEKKKEIE